MPENKNKRNIGITGNSEKNVIISGDKNIVHLNEPTDTKLPPAGFTPLITVVTIAAVSMGLTIILFGYFSAETKAKTDYFQIIITIIIASAICIGFMLALSKVYKNIKILIIILIPLCMAFSVASAAYLLDENVFHIIERIISRVSRRIGYSLRSDPITVSDEEAESVFKLRKDDKRFSFSIWIPTEYIQNDFKDNGDGTITDHATGLMWQKSGSPNWIYLKDVPAYIEKFNSEKFVGYSDWRLPTIDELKSLLTLKEMNGNLYINPLFDKTQRWCWTSDKCASGGAWVVGFVNGDVGWGSLSDDGYARAVRSIQ